MKIQIISKLNRNSQGATCRSVKENTIHSMNKNYFRTQDHIQTEYYPLHDTCNEEEGIETKKSCQYLAFFQDFHKKHAVIYQKKVKEVGKPHRQL